jgi:hypothetical protein
MSLTITRLSGHLVPATISPYDGTNRSGLTARRFDSSGTERMTAPSPDRAPARPGLARSGGVMGASPFRVASIWASRGEGVDRESIRRLAALDQRPAPRGPVVLAEIGGEPSIQAI